MSAARHAVFAIGSASSATAWHVTLLPRWLPHRYDFDAVHDTAKGFGTNIDWFLFGLEPLGILLWWGNLAAMRAGAAKVLHGHKKILERVRRGEAPAEM